MTTIWLGQRELSAFDSQIICKEGSSRLELYVSNKIVEKYFPKGGCCIGIRPEERTMCFYDGLGDRYTFQKKSWKDYLVIYIPVRKLPEGFSLKGEFDPAYIQIKKRTAVVFGMLGSYRKYRATAEDFIWLNPFSESFRKGDDFSVYIGKSGESIVMLNFSAQAFENLFGKAKKIFVKEDGDRLLFSGTEADGFTSYTAFERKGNGTKRCRVSGVRFPAHGIEWAGKRFSLKEEDGFYVADYYEDA